MKHIPDSVMRNYFPSNVQLKSHYIRTLGHDCIATNLSGDLHSLTVTPYGNVLTDLMLPVATSISRKVVIYGCDGKRPGSEEMFFDKADEISKIDNAQKRDLTDVLDLNTYDHYIYMHNVFTRYVVDQCLRKGAQISLRCPSWNAGLQHLPVSLWI